MSCIICHETGEEPLHENLSCSCKYTRHNSCWIDYVHSTSKVKCLLCRKDIVAPPKTKSSLNKPRNPISVPVSSNISPYSQSLLPPGERISYQEFCEIVNSHNTSYQNSDVNITVTHTHVSARDATQTKPKYSTLAKIVMGFCIIALIVTVLVIVL
jgi:hypothetical protein